MSVATEFRGCGVAELHRVMHSIARRATSDLSLLRRASAWRRVCQLRLRLEKLQAILPGHGASVAQNNRALQEVRIRLFKKGGSSQINMI